VLLDGLRPHVAPLRSSRSSRRPDGGNEETRLAVGFVVHVASVCPLVSDVSQGCCKGFVRMLQK
jgi:hypothetical protein